VTFAPYTAVRGCGNDGPGAANMLYWLDRESPWRDVGFNLGVCACRGTGAGSTSQHARCRAWDLGLPLVRGRANPIGHQIVRELIPRAGMLGLTELIWDRRRYSAAHPNGIAYTGVSPHIDHIHGAHTLNATRHLNVPTVRAVMGGAGQAPPPQPPPPPPPVVVPFPTPAPPPPAVDLEDDEDMATYIRLEAPGNPYHGRIELVGSFFRRWTPPAEYNLHVYLGGKHAQNVDVDTWNALTSNKAVVDNGRMMANAA
jgi:hypothetical protein